MQSSAIVFSIGIALYAAVLLFSAGSFLFTACRKNVTNGAQRVTLARRIRVVFRGVLTLFLLARLAWLSLHLSLQLDRDSDKIDTERSSATFVLNRLAFVLYFTSFCLVVFYWAEQYHKSYVETQNFMPQLGLTFILVNAAVYVLQVVFVVLYLRESGDTSKREGDVLYEANIVVDVGLSAAVSIGFLVYGGLLFFVARSSRLDPAALDPNQAALQAAELFTLLMITLIMTACFLLRVVFFSWRLVGGSKFPVAVFYVFAYFIPEIVPSVLQVYLSEATEAHQRVNARTIDDLYAEEAITSGPGSSSDVQRQSNSGSDFYRTSNASTPVRAEAMPPMYDERSLLLQLGGGGDSEDDSY